MNRGGFTNFARDKSLVMQGPLLGLILLLFGAMVVLNVYIRVKVMKAYGRLNRAGVQFTARHVFNKSKREAELYPKYLDHKADIESFCVNLNRTIHMVTILVALLTVYGGVLMYYRHNP